MESAPDPGPKPARCSRTLPLSIQSARGFLWRDEPALSIVGRRGRVVLEVGWGPGRRVGGRGPGRRVDIRASIVWARGDGRVEPGGVWGARVDRSAGAERVLGHGGRSETRSDTQHAGAHRWLGWGSPRSINGNQHHTALLTTFHSHSQPSPHCRNALNIRASRISQVVVSMSDREHGTGTGS